MGLPRTFSACALLPWEHLCEKVSLRMFSDGTPLFLAIQVSFSTYKLVTFILESPLHPLRYSRTCSGSKRKLEDFLMSLVQFSPCPVTSRDFLACKTQTYFRLSLVCGGDQRQPEIHLRSHAMGLSKQQQLVPKIPGTVSCSGGVLPIMAYTGRLRPKRVPFLGFSYLKG